MLSFERAISDDYPALSNLIHAAFHTDKLAFESSHELYETPEILLEYISSRRTWIIQNDNTIIGCAVVIVNRDKSGVLKCLAIHPDYQNLGFGTQTIQWLESQYIAVRIWHLNTPAANMRTRHFFEKTGFLKIEETSADTPQAVYEKNLDRPAEDPDGGCLYKNIAELAYDEPHTETLLHTDLVKTERLIFRGQAENEWNTPDHELHFLIISGYAFIDIDGKSYELRSGDWRIVHPLQKYRFTRTSREPACICHVTHFFSHTPNH